MGETPTPDYSDYRSKQRKRIYKGSDGQWRERTDYNEFRVIYTMFDWEGEYPVVGEWRRDINFAVQSANNQAYKQGWYGNLKKRTKDIKVEERMSFYETIVKLVEVPGHFLQSEKRPAYCGWDLH